MNQTGRSFINDSDLKLNKDLSMPLSNYQKESTGNDFFKNDDDLSPVDKEFLQDSQPKK